MFDKRGFDKSWYDRSTAIEHIDATLRGTSDLEVLVLFKTPIDTSILNGNGEISTTPIMLQSMKCDLSGDSSVEVNKFKLLQKIKSDIEGDSNIIPGVGVKVPLELNVLEGSGEIENEKNKAFQFMDTELNGIGDVNLNLILRVYINSLLSGDSSTYIDDQFKLLHPISVALEGDGEVEVTRVGALNSSTIEFTDLSLKSGQTLIIDTDELNVLIDNILDVSKVTSDSVFFQLQPGENEITFTSPNNPDLSVTIIWQNRWL